MAAEITRERLLELYEKMLLIRRTEEQAAKGYTLKKILGFCHLYIGQEAVAVGACAALQPQDTVVSAYREHGHYLARGGSPDAVMAELFGKSTGMCKGIGGSMHMADSDLNFFGGYGIVGGHIPLATGAAFASQYRGDNAVALCFFGDGATHQGAFFEALALAQLWALPVVFLCENNFYAMGTSLERQSYLTDLARRGDGVGMAQWQVGGFDVCEVFQSATKAVDHARSGKGPVLLEAITYRYRGHSMSDPAKYRKDGELDEKKKHDCLMLAEHRLRDDFSVSDDEIARIGARVKATAKAAYTNADAAPPAELTKLYDFTYAE